MKITWEEWVSELSRCKPSQDGWMTSREIMDGTGMAEKKVRDMIRAGIQKGNIETSFQPRINMIGVVINAPCYRIKKRK